MDQTDTREDRSIEPTRVPGDGFAEEPPRSSAAEDGGSGWVTTGVAAAALRVTPRTVRDYIRVGGLEAKSEGKGVNKTWLVSIDSVQELRESRRTSAVYPRNFRGHTAEAINARTAAEDTAEAFRELIVRLEARTAEAADARARLELTAHAESTLRESLERERQRTDALQEETDRLRAELEEAKVSWWRRFFGFR